MNRAKLLIIAAFASSLIALMALAAPGASNHGGPPPHPTASTTATATPTPTTTAPSGGGSVGSDFKQCENDNVAPHACTWSGAILQQNNAEYSEGMSVPQQLILDGLTGSTHSLSFQSQASKGGKHAYDYITSFSQAAAAADLLRPGEGLMANIELCNGLNGQALTRCNALRASANTVDVSAPDAMGFLEGHNIAASVTNYEIQFGNRFVEIYASPGASAITGATLTFAGYTGSGDQEANYVLSWTSDSSDIMVRWAGHLAVGPDVAVGYGADTGSSSISGGPYHWGLSGLDGGSLGNQANQIQGSDINAVPASGAITIMKDAVPNSLQDFSFSSPTLSPTSFILDDDGAVPGADATRSTTQVFSDIAPGVYVVTEDAVFGWSLSSLSSCSALGIGSSATFNIATRTATITLGAAGSVTCNFINDATLPTLKIVKNITNDDGGTLGLADVDLKIDGVEVDNNTATQVSLGVHQVSESQMSGYLASAWSGACDADGLVTLAVAQVATCYITNDDIPAQLTIIKNITNDDGGLLGLADVDLFIDETEVVNNTATDVSQGVHQLSESAMLGYEASAWSGACDADGLVTLALAQIATCYITNDDMPAQLTIIKNITNDDGGLLVLADVDLKIDGTEVANATATEVSQGVHQVSESAMTGYAASDWSGACDGDGLVTLALAQIATCYITNDDIAATLTIIKNITNDDGGLLGLADVDLMIDGIEALNNTATDVSQGVHSVTESVMPGYSASAWTGDCEAQGSITLALAQVATCFVTNDDIPAQLTIIKNITNDDGGLLGLANVDLMIDGLEVANATATEVSQGVHEVSESAMLGYQASAWSGDCDAEGAINLVLAQLATCYVTNDDIAAQLTLIKNITNDDGGLLGLADVDLKIDGVEVANNTATEVSQGIHQVMESSMLGYAASAWSGACDADGFVTLALAQMATCYITNDDIPAKLTIIKNVTNDDGGLLGLADVDLLIDAMEVANNTATDVNQGAHQVSESSMLGYQASAWSGACAADGSVTLALAQVATCYITNDDIPATLTLIKNITNDDGGLLGLADVDLMIDGIEVANNTGLELSQGSHLVSESAMPGYAASGWSGDCASTGSVSLALAQVATCYITNDDIPAQLTIIKNITNDDGGLLGLSDVDLKIDGIEVANNTATDVSQGGHQVNESSMLGYQASGWSGDCASDGSITLLLAQVATCYITNDDIPAQLTIIKNITNDDGGLLGLADVDLKIDGVEVSNSTATDVSQGGHQVSESVMVGYAASAWSGACSSDGLVTLALAQVATCYITNDDIPATLTIIKNITNDDGGLLGLADVDLKIDGLEVANNTATDVSQGTHAVSESAMQGYAASGWSGDCASDGSVTLVLAQLATCYITNDDIPAKLTIIKNITNDDGGLLSLADVDLKIDGVEVSNSTATDVSQGAHVASESAMVGYQASAWSGACDADGLVTLALAQVATCYITNDDIPAQLTIIKNITNDDGGLLGLSDVDLMIDSVEFPNNTAIEVSQGLHQVSESQMPGYQASPWSGDCAPDGSISLVLDQDATCYITNDDIAPTLTLVKNITNDDGGQLTIGQVTLRIDGTAVANATATSLVVGSYTASEDLIAGYSASAWSGDCSAGGVVSLSLDEDATCYITNDDIAPTLTVIKHVINDNGGDAVAAAFDLEVRAGASLVESDPGVESPGMTYTLVANVLYTVDESGGPSGYAKSFAGDCEVSMQPGDVKNCTITNDDIAPKLLVKKVVVNDDGGPEVPGNWTMYVAGVNVSSASFPGATAGTLVTMDAGAFQVSESLLPAGYAANFSSDCSGTMVVGNEKTCTVTNDDIRPELTVIKLVVNDHGGGLTADDFTMRVTGIGASPASFAGNATGTLVTMAAGPYTADEDAMFGYAKTLSTDCSGSMVVGDKKTCTITNDDIQPRLTVIKHVINDDGQSKVAADFTMLVTGTAVSQSSFPGAESPGVTITLNAGAYNVDEVYDSAYAKDRSEGCQDTIEVGETRICVITNNDIGPTRTQGFWGQHTAFTTRIFDDRLGEELIIGSGPGAKIIDTQGELFGAFLSDIKKESDKEKRDPVEQARMQLAQQLAAARLNCAAFGCNEETLDMLADADDAYVGTDVSLILQYVGLVDAYNNSRDSMPITPTLGSWGKATAKDSRALADIPFWDETIS